MPCGHRWARSAIRRTADIVHRVAELRPDVLFVDAPVLWQRRDPQRQASCSSLPSGASAATAIASPAFSAIGRRTLWLGDAGQGSRMKLAVNSYLSILIEGVAETLELADRLGIATAQLEDAIEGGPLRRSTGASAKLAQDGERRLCPGVPARVGPQGRRLGDRLDRR